MKVALVILGLMLLGAALDLGLVEPVHQRIAILCCFLAAIVFAGTFPHSHGGRPA
jgi:hypothetical protein